MKFKKMFIVANCIILAFGGLAAQETANAIDTYFQQYLEDEDFSVVYISPRLFQLIESFGTEELDLDDKEAEAFMDMTSDLRGLRILSTDKNPQRFFNEFKEKINTIVYEPLITIREKGGGKTEFYLKEDKAGKITELLFFSFGEEDFTFMSFVGAIQLDKVIKLAEELENK